jgi:hypothetical protein
VAAGAGTNSTDNDKSHAVNCMAFILKIGGTLMLPDFYQTVQRSASGLTIGEPSLLFKT